MYVFTSLYHVKEIFLISDFRIVLKRNTDYVYHLPLIKTISLFSFRVNTPKFLECNLLSYATHIIDCSV